MTLKTPMAGLVLALLLAGCGNEKNTEIQSSVAGQIAQGVIEARRGPKPPPDLGGGPAIQAKIANLDLDLRMVVLDRDGDVTIWHDGQGRQIATRNGLLIWTRGLGSDLMSAKVPTPGAIRLGSQYQRLNVYVDGADQRYERLYDCVVEPAPEPDTTVAGKHLLEVCQGPVGKVRNEFWMNGSRIVKSRQWVSSSFGHVEITPL